MQCEYKSHNGQQSNALKLLPTQLNHSSTVPSLQLSGYDFMYAVKSGLNNNMSMSHRSTKSSIYSQTSKLQKSSVFHKVNQCKQIETVKKRLQQKYEQLQCIKNTKYWLEQKVFELETRLKAKSENAVQQSKKIRSIFCRLFQK